MVITKEQFTDIIIEHKHWNKRIDEVEKALDTMILETDWVSYGATLFEAVLRIFFEKEGIDLISWWLWEKSDNDKILDEDSNELPSDTVEDLWELVKDYRIK